MMPNPIPDDAVERAAEALKGERTVSHLDRHYAAWKALSAAAARFPAEGSVLVELTREQAEEMARWLGWCVVTYELGGTAVQDGLAALRSALRALGLLT